ncbi:MAG: metal-dependent hydrolase [Pseudomonadota bacterium]
MDSLSQALLGASVAGAFAPSKHRGKAMLLGAALGTLPDMDVLIDYGGAVENFTYHRGFSHSLFVLVPFAVVIWLALRRWWAPVGERPGRWLAAISLALVTHALLDAHTAYGTQLLWPMDVPPTSWATLFIIDPLYTLPLLISVLIATFWRRLAGRALQAALILSTAYIGWSWIGQTIATQHFEAALAELRIEDAELFVTPTPLNTMLWRGVAVVDGVQLEGFDSLLIDEGGVEFSHFDQGATYLAEAADIWAVQQLRWFAQGFVRAEVEDDQLVISDLRMGQHPFYVFNHIVAERGDSGWNAVTTEMLPRSIGDRAIAETWQRIWQEPR